MTVPVLCDKCRRAQNPKSTLAWHKLPDESYLCGNCYAPPLPEPQVKGPELVVIDCPACKYVPIGIAETYRCGSCDGLRVVRIAANRVLVYAPQVAAEAPKLLTEGGG